jgi:hypothetical protein
VVRSGFIKLFFEDQKIESDIVLKEVKVGEMDLNMALDIFLLDYKEKFNTFMQLVYFANLPCTEKKF